MRIILLSGEAWLRDFEKSRNHDHCLEHEVHDVHRSCVSMWLPLTLPMNRMALQLPRRDRRYGNFGKIFEQVRQNCNVSFHLCFSLTHQQLTLRMGKRATAKGNYFCFVVLLSWWRDAFGGYQLYSQSTQNKTFTRKSCKSCPIRMTTKWPVQRTGKREVSFRVVSVQMQLWHVHVHWRNEI